MPCWDAGQAVFLPAMACRDSQLRMFFRAAGNAESQLLMNHQAAGSQDSGQIMYFLFTGRWHCEAGDGRPEHRGCPAGLSGLPFRNNIFDERLQLSIPCVALLRSFN